MERHEIEYLLFDDLNRTKSNYDEARGDFYLAISDIPSGLPSPDGSLRITRAGLAKSCALHAYTEALRSMDNYLLKGEIPERIRKILE